MALAYDFSYTKHDWLGRSRLPTMRTFYGHTLLALDSGVRLYSIHVQCTCTCSCIVYMYNVHVADLILNPPMYACTFSEDQHTHTCIYISVCIYIRTCTWCIYIVHVSVQELTHKMAQYWESLVPLPQSALDTIEDGGYYTLLIREKLRLLSFNSDYG